MQKSTFLTTGGWEGWKTFDSEIKTTVIGIHDVYFVCCEHKGCKLFNLDWCEFSN
ncbi:carbohydrate-binding protein [Phocaeicola sp.]|uniref:carbohydrate-binding protein n=1 Tax=Phocaeicola sp. TaxID=2773926 RepID=UPI003A934FDC